MDRREAEVGGRADAHATVGRHRQGVGTQLLGAALEAADRTGVVAVFLEGDPNFYGPRGFVPGASLGFERPSPRIPEPGFQVASLSRRESWMTGQVIFPDAMWDTDMVGLRDPLLARIEDALESRSDQLDAGEHEAATPH